MLQFRVKRRMTWDRVRIDDFGTIGSKHPEIEAIDKKNIWVMCRSGTVIRTEDGGRSWKIHVLDQKSADRSEEDLHEEEDEEGRMEVTEFVSFKPCDKDVCWAAIELDHSDIYIYRTMNGGKTWEMTSPQSFSRVSDIQSVDQDQAFIMGRTAAGRGKAGASTYEPTPSGNALIATFDGGKTWSEPWLDEVSGIDLVDENTLWAVVPGNPQSRVVIATDAGGHWKESLVDIPTSNLTREGSRTITPAVSGFSSSCAWIYGGGSSWWAAATTIDAGLDWTYYYE